MNKRMSKRILRRFDAIDLGKYAAISDDILAFACDNITDVPGPEKPGCFVATVQMYLDAPGDYPWMDEYLAETNVDPEGWWSEDVAFHNDFR